MMPSPGVIWPLQLSKFTVPRDKLITGGSVKSVKGNGNKTCLHSWADDCAFFPFITTWRRSLTVSVGWTWNPLGAFRCSVLWKQTSSSCLLFSSIGNFCSGVSCETSSAGTKDTGTTSLHTCHWLAAAALFLWALLSIRNEKKRRVQIFVSFLLLHRLCVLVFILVLCVLLNGACTIAVRNYQNQELS